MILNRFKKVLLVTPEFSFRQLTADYKNIQHVHAIERIFPAIFQSTPNLIILDYNYISKDIEKIVRRIRTNTFYNKIKICCYKTKPEIKTDGLLKAIGVDYFVYQEELQSIQKNNNIAGVFNELLDLSVVGLMPKASN
jgi:hypothetical protein